VPKKPGINRITWDLRYDKTAEVQLWTPVVDHEHATSVRKDGGVSRRDATGAGRWWSRGNTR